MFSAGTVIAATAIYLLMLAAFFLPRQRRFHIPVMIVAMVFDFCMPFYLYLTKDWYRRLITEGELTSFLLWTHLLLVLTLYMLYVMQIQSARRILRGELNVRTDHHAQGKAVLLVRALVIMTGALMVETPKH